MIKKDSVREIKHSDHILSERLILKYLTMLNQCPFIVRYYESFSNQDNLYFELEYLRGSNLLMQIRNKNKKV